MTVTRRSPLTNVRSLAAIATSVPVPIARPRSACARGGRVVDAVTGHRYHVAVGLQPRDRGDLLVGQHARDDLVEADLVRDSPRGGLVVAGEQDVMPSI